MALVYVVILNTPVAVAQQATTPGQQSGTQKFAAGEEVVDWKKDQVCQAVFFGVLEGLYRDGVADDVVNNLIGPSSDQTDFESMQKRMRRSFVLDCPLCQPTFEALLAYQNRPSFSDGSRQRGFGSGLDRATRKGLLDSNTQSRLQALKPMVQKWVQAKFDSSGLTESEIASWRSNVQSRVNEGRQDLIELMAEDEEYRGWSLYWGCAACNGARDAAMTIKVGEK